MCYPFSTSNRIPPRAPLALALAAALGIAPLAAFAATVTVTSPGDTNQTVGTTCTLRQAIVTMNHGATANINEGNCRTGASGPFGSNDTIVFDTGVFPSDGGNIITLAYGRLAISASNLTIDATANGGVIIDANHASRVMIDTAAAGGSLTLLQLILRNGIAITPDCLGENYGGGICIPSANLTLTSSTFSGNAAFGGGGIFASGGVITLNKSTLSNNSASAAGGGLLIGDGSATLTDSTLSGNSTQGRGGGIYAGVPTKSITLNNSTISGNSAGYLGGGIGFGGDSPVANNSIVSGNTGGDFASATPFTGDNNLIGKVTNLNLGPLQDNGGPTQTMQPLQGSAAIDTGNDADCLPADQRGIKRPQGAHCDIGAVEVIQVGSLVAVAGSDQSSDIWHGLFNPLTVQVLDSSNQPEQDVTLQALPNAAGQAGATCANATSNGGGFAFLYCTANGIAGRYSVTVQAPGSLVTVSATFVLSNANDGDTIFIDGFDPPGPRINAADRGGQ